jgi:hypothetical protein
MKREPREQRLDDIFDDLTADYYNDKPYYVSQPTFEEFSAIHERLVESFTHNAIIGNWPIGDTSDKPDEMSTKTLKVKWQNIATWYDVADYMDDWVFRQLPKRD